MYRALVGDLHQPLALLGVERAFQRDGAVDVVDSLRAVAVGDAGTILLTVDGGATWTTVPSGVGETLFSVRMTATGEGYAVGAGGVALTTLDGGITWQRQVTYTSQAGRGGSECRRGGERKWPQTCNNVMKKRTWRRFTHFLD